MIDVFRKQYALVQASRKILFDFLSREVGDEQMNVRFSAFADKSICDLLDIPFRRVQENRWWSVVTPLELFTHVTTHEFHHKGQIVLLCRMLGHVPCETDVCNSFNEGSL